MLVAFFLAIFGVSKTNAWLMSLACDEGTTEHCLLKNVELLFQKTSSVNSPAKNMLKIGWGFDEIH